MDVLAPFHMALRGAALGFIYGLHYVYKKRWVLSFPIIQRPLFFSLKMGIPSAAKRALKLSVLALPFSVLMFFLHGNLYGNGMGTFLKQQVVFFLGAYFITFCWELIHHLI
jgi:nucleoporin NDC1